MKCIRYDIVVLDHHLSVVINKVLELDVLCLLLANDQLLAPLLHGQAFCYPNRRHISSPGVTLRASIASSEKHVIRSDELQMGVRKSLAQVFVIQRVLSVSFQSIQSSKDWGFSGFKILCSVASKLSFHV